MVEEEYVSFETAKLLKEKGFDERTEFLYEKSKTFNNGNHKLIESYSLNKELLPECYSAPTQSLVMRWLRETQKIVICINMLNENHKGNNDYTNPDRWWYYFDIVNNKGVFREELQPEPLSNEYDSYEEACEAAIQYCLKNLI